MEHGLNSAPDYKALYKQCSKALKKVASERDAAIRATERLVAVLNDLNGPMAFGEPKMNNETKPDAPAKGFAEIRRDQVFAAIDSERIYQELKWGTLEEHPQSVGAYLTLMRVHLARAENAWAGANNDLEALNCLRKVLAIGVACGEQHGMPRRHDAEPTLRANPFSDDEHD